MLNSAWQQIAYCGDRAEVIQQTVLVSSVHLLRNGKELCRFKIHRLSHSFIRNSKKREHQHMHKPASQRSKMKDGCARPMEHVAVICTRLVIICLGHPDVKQLRIPDICLIAAQTRKVGKSTMEPELNWHKRAAEASRF